jgi:hypothetical protein
MVGAAEVHSPGEEGKRFLAEDGARKEAHL